MVRGVSPEIVQRFEKATAVVLEHPEGIPWDRLATKVGMSAQIYRGGGIKRNPKVIYLIQKLEKEGFARVERSGPGWASAIVVYPPEVSDE